jgi:excinuclease ABC subunit B
MAYMSKEEIAKQIKLTQKNMEKAAKDLDFIEAAKFRDELDGLKKLQ